MNTGGTFNTGIHKRAQNWGTGHTTARSHHICPSACHIMTAIHHDSYTVCPLPPWYSFLALPKHLQALLMTVI